MPKHEIITEKDAKKVLEKYNITRGQLPKIMSTDPIVKKLDADIGKVIKVTRPSRTAGKSIFYRVVVGDQVGGEMKV